LFYELEGKPDKSFLNIYWRDSWTLMGFVISAIGTLLSVWAVIEAAGAKEAAEDTKKELLKKRLQFFGESAIHDIDSIDQFLLTKKYEIASYLLLRVANDFSRLASLAQQSLSPNYEEIRVFNVELNEWRSKCLNHPSQSKFSHFEKWSEFAIRVKSSLNQISSDYRGQ
jgi:hypothetical protein